MTAKRGTETLLFDLDMLNKEMNTNGFDSLKQLPTVTFTDDKTSRFRTRNTYLSQPSAQRVLASYKRRAPGGAALFTVIIGEG